MTIKIGLIGDVHSHLQPLATALELLQQAAVEVILCTGDIAGYGDDLDRCVELLIEYGCQTVIGNHDRWYLQDITEHNRSRVDRWLARLPAQLEFTIDGKRLYLVHARPPDDDFDGIRLLDKEGRLISEHKTIWQAKLTGFDYDILVVGHSHQVYAEKLGDILVINPGSPCFNHVYGILSLPSMKVEFFPLPGEEMIKSWNWGTYEVEKV